MNSNPPPSPALALLGEAFIDAYVAAHRLNLPRYWLTHPKQRALRCVPHYRIGVSVRFKLSELESWLQCRAQAEADHRSRESSTSGGRHA